MKDTDLDLRQRRPDCDELHASHLRQLCSILCEAGQGHVWSVARHWPHDWPLFARNLDGVLALWPATRNSSSP
jgi:hypothetical protein